MKPFLYPYVYQSNYISPFTPNYYYSYPITISPMHQINYLENKINQLEHSLFIKQPPFNNHKKRIVSTNIKILPPIHNYNKHVHTSSFPHSQSNHSKHKLLYRSKSLSNSMKENDINNLLYAKVSAVFDRKYKERKLRYENLLLKEKLLKYGKVNDLENDYVNSKDTIRNKYITKLINDKLKPIEDKQKKFMEIINKLLIYNEKDVNVSNKKVLKKQNVWENQIKGNDKLFKSIDFLVKEEMTNPQNSKQDNDNDNDNDNKSNPTNDWELFDYTKYHIDDNSNETNNNNNNN